MRRLSKGRTALVLGVMVAGSLVGGSLFAPVLAQSQSITGLNVMRVEYNGPSGLEVFLRTPPNIWIHYDENGRQLGRYVEVNRQPGNVFLRDNSNNRHMVLLTGENQVLEYFIATGAAKILGTIAATSLSPGEAPVANPFASSASDPAANGAFNPLADPSFNANSGASSPQGSISSARPGTPQFVADQNAANRGGNGALTGNDPFASKPYDGPWVVEGAIPRRTGDGLTGPVSWTVPELIWISSTGPDTIIIHRDSRPHGSLPMSRMGPNQFGGLGYSATFVLLGGREYRLVLASGSVSQKFLMSKLSSGRRLTRTRIKPEADPDADRDSFQLGADVQGAKYMFNSYRGEEMDFFSQSRGVGRQIFYTPGPGEYAPDLAINKTVPFGVRGLKEIGSASTQTETMVTNMATYQKSMAYNFGASGGAGSASLGVNVSREQSSGSESSRGTTRARGIARAQTFVLVLDKPNMQLDPGFRYDVLALGTGAMGVAEFRETYGTYYANAIHFGGIGMATKEMTNSELKSYMQKSLSVSAEGGAKGVSLKGGFTETEGSSNGSTSLFSTSNWRAAGGSGSMGAEGWTVGEDNSVPIRYDLRPLAELISPIFFPEEWNSPQRAGLLAARGALSVEIERYMASQPALPDKRIGTAVYELTFHSLDCVDNGDEGRANAEVYGEFSAVVGGADGPAQIVSLLSATEDMPVSISCRGGAGYRIDKTILVTANRNAARQGEGNALLYTAAAGGFENDNSFTDTDDPVQSETNAPIYLKDWRPGQPTSDIIGLGYKNAKGFTGGPHLRVRVSWREVE